MTNKIIAVLAFMVMALSIVAYNLWNEATGDDDNGVATENIQETEQPPEIKTTNAEQTLAQDDAGSDSHRVAGKQINETGEAEDNENKLFCELTHEYDDWYRQGDGYESNNFMQDVKSWAFSRGYFETEYSKGGLGIKKKSDYDYYELDDLEGMAKAGDSMANVRLAYKLYLKGDKDSMERAQPYCDQAIIDGYTGLIICKSSHLARQIYTERRKEEQNRDQELLKQLELDFLAWRGVASEFGDKLGETLSLSLMGELNHEFTEQSIQQRTEQLVDDVRSKRAELGLGPMSHPPMPKLLAYVLENDVESEDAINVCFE